MSRCTLLLAGLAAAWLGTAQAGPGQGTIAYFRPATPIPLWLPPDSLELFRRQPLDFDGDGTLELTFSYGVVFLGVRSEQASRLLVWLSPPPNIGGPIAPLPGGFEIGPNSGSGNLQWFGDNFDVFDTLVHCTDGCSGAFLGQHAYMGVRFERAGATHYGWVLLDVSAHQAAGQIEAWAWETRPGMPIKAGAKPVQVLLAPPMVARPGYLRVNWPSEVGKAYQVQAKARVDALMWTNLSFTIPATSTNTMVDLPMSGAARFFRVVEAD